MKPKIPSVIPRLSVSPFAAVIVDPQTLIAEDRSFLKVRENIIEAGRKTFWEVGTALLEIRDYKEGLLYKSFGTFDAYCKEQWDIGHSHAYRMMDAAKVYRGLSPRGDKADAVLPVTEKQIRPLTKLPPDLQSTAWQNAVRAAGSAPVRARDVTREVGRLIDAEGLAPHPLKPKPASPQFHRLSHDALEKIRSLLQQIRECGASGGAKRIADFADEIADLLPGT